MKNKKILIFDTDKNNKPIENYIKELGYDFLGYSTTPKETLFKIFEFNPCIVLIDINLINKHEAIKTANFINKYFFTSIIFVISKIDYEIIEGIKKIKSYGYLFGNVDKEQFQLTLESALFKISTEKDKSKIITEDLSDQTINVLKVQKSIIPKNHQIINNIYMNWMFFPSFYGSGDIFNCFPLGDSHLGFYLLDVMGHGFQSALMSTMLHRYLYPEMKKGSLLRRFKENSKNNLRRRKHDFLPSIVSPKDVLEELNDIFYEKDSSSFFTIIYGIINTVTYEAKLARAGHLYPSYVNPKGQVSQLKSNGIAIGVTSAIEVEEYEFVFEEGARLYLYSDGLLDVGLEKNSSFSNESLNDYFKNTIKTPLESTIKNLENKILSWSDYSKFKDDIALLALERVQVI